MSTEQAFDRSISLPVTAETAFAYHERPGALQRLTPPWQSMRVACSDHSLTVGSKVQLHLRQFGIPLRWLAEHTEYDPPHKFVDIQVRGPFRKWHHTHRFDNIHAESSADSPEGCVLTDSVRYELPLSAASAVLIGKRIRDDLDAMFTYRHAVTMRDLSLFDHYGLAPLRIAISGASGLVGKELCTFLNLAGHRVDRLTRSQPHGSTSKSIEQAIAVWDSESEASRLSGCDAVIHLAGEPIASSRWTEAKKQAIRQSRVELTRLLCQRLAKLSHKPKVLICASATGIYGDRGDEILDEASAPGKNFVAEVAAEWEDACEPARQAGIRVVNTRFGMILTPRGGALAKMLLPAKLAAGRLGTGRQWWSWIALDDVLGAFYHSLATPALVGPVNFVSPQPLINADFAEILGRVLHRPALIPAPTWGIRLALGQMADELLLASARVLPRQLETSGYRFAYPDLEAALRHLLGR